MHQIATKAHRVDKTTNGELSTKLGVRKEAQRTRVSYLLKSATCFVLLALSFCLYGLLGRGNNVYILRRTTESFLTTSLDSVTDVPSIFRYLSDVVMPVFYPEAYDLGLSGTVMGGTAIRIGVPRLRQLRISADSCEIAGVFEDTLYRCVEKQGASIKNDDSLDGFQARPESFTEALDYVRDAPVLYAWRGKQYYPGEGFVKEFGATHSEATAALAALRESVFIDWSTRALFLEFTFYSANVDLLLAGAIIFEFSPTGAILPSFKFTTVPYFRYHRLADNSALMVDYVTFTFELIVYVMTAITLMLEVTEVRTRYSGSLVQYYKHSFFHVISHLSVCLIFAKMIFMFYMFGIAEEMASGMDSTDTFVNCHVYALVHARNRYLDTAIAFVLVLQAFKFLRWHKRLRVLVDTISRCLAEITVLLFVVVILLVGYAVSFHLLFGMNVRSYLDFSESLMTLMMTMLGSFNLEELRRYNKIMGPLLFASFFVIIVFVILSMLYALVNLEYQDVKRGTVSTGQKSALTRFLADLERQNAFQRDWEILRNAVGRIWPGSRCRKGGKIAAEGLPNKQGSQQPEAAATDNGSSVLSKLKVIQGRLREKEDDNIRRATTAAQLLDAPSDAPLKTREKNATKESEKKPDFGKKRILEQLLSMEESQRSLGKAVETVAKRCR